VRVAALDVRASQPARRGRPGEPNTDTTLSVEAAADPTSLHTHRTPLGTASKTIPHATTTLPAWPFHPSPYLAFNRPAPLSLRVPSCFRQPGALLVRTWPGGGDGTLARNRPGCCGETSLRRHDVVFIICCILGVVRWPSVSWFLSLSYRICFIFSLLIYLLNFHFLSGSLSAVPLEGIRGLAQDGQ
jgi:hypothetical protein